MIIGLGYRARVGKDTVGDYLVQNHGFVRLGFADALKEGCRAMFGFSQEQLYGDLKEVIDPYWGVTPRFMLQKIGTDCIRTHYDQDVWVKSLGKQLDRLVLDGKSVVITDVRFPNEGDILKERGGFVVRIDRDIDGATGGISGHSSETVMGDYDKWDYILDNRSTVPALYNRVEGLLAKLK